MEIGLNFDKPCEIAIARADLGTMITRLEQEFRLDKMGEPVNEFGCLLVGYHKSQPPASEFAEHLDEHIADPCLAPKSVIGTVEYE
jgi:hypothetical protein